jgi:hypothetical protein
MVIDVRANGGGNVSSMIIERLQRQVLATGFSRNDDHPSVYPRAPTFHGSLVTILDENSASDGDIFPAMFRQAGLGPLITATRRPASAVLLQSFPGQRRLLVGACADLHGRGEPRDAFRVECLVHEPDCREDVSQLALDVRAERVQLDLQPRTGQQLVRALHLRPHGHAHAEGNHLDLSSRFHEWTSSLLQTARRRRHIRGHEDTGMQDTGLRRTKAPARLHDAPPRARAV